MFLQENPDADVADFDRLSPEEKTYFLKNMKLSYLVSTYDSGRYLDRHIDNIINGQTDPDFEVIIVNPNSPGTDDIIARKWLAIDDRVRYFYKPKREPYSVSWLRAWRHAKGDFVINSNTDDLHDASTTQIVHRHMRYITSPMHIDQKIAFAYGGMTVINENDQIVGRGLKPPFNFELMSRECWAGPQVIWRNDQEFRHRVDWKLMVKRARQYHSAFDYWLWLYFMSLGFHGYSIQEMITVYTQRSDSLENKDKWQNNWETYSAISEFFPYHFDGELSHAKEFRDFKNRPLREEWVCNMKSNQNA